MIKIILFYKCLLKKRERLYDAVDRKETKMRYELIAIYSNDIALGIWLIQSVVCPKKIMKDVSHRQ
jgi:hypothetical protein